MTLALIDERISFEAERRLSALGFFPIRMKKNKRLSPDIASHPDILCFHDRNTLITSCTYAEDAPYIFTDIREYCPELKIYFCDDRQSEKYPNDCIYNALRFGSRLFCKTDSVSEGVLRYAERSGLECIRVKQGYPRCSVLKLRENTAVTADAGMARVLSENGIKVYRIRAGHVKLEGREYGFIGGCAGVFGDTVYSLGDIDTHPDSEIIKDAVRDSGMKHLSLCEGELTDLGTILFL
jgi:hypothetical protein